MKQKMEIKASVLMQYEQLCMVIFVIYYGFDILLVNGRAISKIILNSVPDLDDKD